jgi:hypothetical protein
MIEASSYGVKRIRRVIMQPEVNALLTKIENDIKAFRAADVVTPVPPVPEPPPPVIVTDNIFAPTSFWYKPIPVDAPLAHNSQVLTDEFNRQRKLAYNGVCNINTKEYCAPIYVVPADQPMIPVEVLSFGGGVNTFFAESIKEGVPIPDYAKASLGTDAEMVLYQPSTDRMWELWQARKDAAGKWTTKGGGGCMTNVSKSDGRWPHDYLGTTATRLPFMGGQITLKELKAGEIKHVLGLSIIEAHATRFSWPARRTDGWNRLNLPEDKIPWEGMRLRLSPAVDISVIRHPLARMIAKAAQVYGFVIWDRAGAISLRCNNTLGYVDGNINAPSVYNEILAGVPSYDIMKDFPWTQLQWMPVDYGKP